MSKVEANQSQYLKELRELHDEALIESGLWGVRRKLGKLSVGKAVALWRSGEGGESWLSEGGIRLGEAFTPIMRQWQPASELLMVGERSDEDYIDIVEFKLHLNPKSGFVKVYRTIENTNATRRQYLQSIPGRIKAQMQERRLGLADPSEEDLDILRQELERGASGAFALKGLYDETD